MPRVRMSAATTLLPLSTFMAVQGQLSPFLLISTYMTSHPTPSPPKKQVIFLLLPVYTAYEDGADRVFRNVGI